MPILPPEPSEDQNELKIPQPVPQADPNTVYSEIDEHVIEELEYQNETMKYQESVKQPQSSLYFNNPSISHSNDLLMIL